ncbi:hypothetical protein [Paenibacillus sp. FSL R7-0337]|uniref:hypothetical protein n=1 Tax=Paenibacillus sp. FSL R7-0337 TaxID=1926588 RepID=UPI0015C39AEA|nr:hypothetical protein [Paenibacillus sp. FSL R7-0337]
MEYKEARLVVAIQISFFLLKLFFFSIIATNCALSFRKEIVKSLHPIPGLQASC